jgi:hypothetical protein
MTESSLPPTPVIIASFFKRLLGMEAIIRVILKQANLSAAFTFKGDPQKKVLFDFSKPEANVAVDETTHAANIHMKIDSETMHDILLGKIKPGLALGQRRMLLRGSAINLARFLPMFDFSPALYREHLADTGYGEYSRNKGPAPLKEAVMSGDIFKGDPIPVIDRSTTERIIIKLIERFAYMTGYLVGVIRHRLVEKLCIFDVLSAMSKGLEAAAPKSLNPGDK